MRIKKKKLYFFIQFKFVQRNLYSNVYYIYLHKLELVKLKQNTHNISLEKENKQSM